MSISIAMIALEPKPQISGAAIARDLAATWPSLPAASDMEHKDGTLSFSIGKALVALGLMPAPIPWQDLEGPCATSWLWPQAGHVLKKHKQHLIVTISDERPPVERTKLLSQVVAAILATCPQALGVYWGNATLVISPQLFREFAVRMLPDGLPLYIWIDFRIGPGKDGKSAGFTQGMKWFDHMELESLNANEPPGELRERMFGLCCYLIENGPVIRDGDTVGQDAKEQIRVVYSPSAFGHKGQVMRLDYGTVQSAKPWWKVW
jgi:hypothetical protein